MRVQRGAIRATTTRALSSPRRHLVGVWSVEKEEIRQEFGGVEIASDDEESRRCTAPSNPATRVAELCGVTGEVSFALRRRA